MNSEELSKIKTTKNKTNSDLSAIVPAVNLTPLDLSWKFFPFHGTQQDFLSNSSISSILKPSNMTP